MDVVYQITAPLALLETLAGLVVGWRQENKPHTRSLSAVQHCTIAADLRLRERQRGGASRRVDGLTGRLLLLRSNLSLGQAVLVLLLSVQDPIPIPMARRE